MKVNPAGPAAIVIAARAGHVHEIFWDCERWKAPKELAATYPNRPQRYKPTRYLR